MSAFLSPLFTDELDDNRAVLLSDFIYQSDCLGRLVTVPKGFETDYASVPRLPFAYWMAGGTGKKAAVIHDFLYRKSGVPRADADAVFLEAMKCSGQSWWRRGLMWLGVRSFGWTAYDERTT